MLGRDPAAKAASNAAGYDPGNAAPSTPSVLTSDQRYIRAPVPPSRWLPVADERSPVLIPATSETEARYISIYPSLIPEAHALVALLGLRSGSHDKNVLAAIEVLTHYDADLDGHRSTIPSEKCELCRHRPHDAVCLRPAGAGCGWCVAEGLPCSPGYTEDAPALLLRQIVAYVLLRLWKKADATLIATIEELSPKLFDLVDNEAICCDDHRGELAAHLPSRLYDDVIRDLGASEPRHVLLSCLRLEQDSRLFIQERMDQGVIGFRGMLELAGPVEKEMSALQKVDTSSMRARIVAYAPLIIAEWMTNRAQGEPQNATGPPTLAGPNSGMVPYVGPNAQPRGLFMAPPNTVSNSPPSSESSSRSTAAQGNSEVTTQAEAAAANGLAMTRRRVRMIQKDAFRRILAEKHKLDNPSIDDIIRILEAKVACPKRLRGPVAGEQVALALKGVRESLEPVMWEEIRWDGRVSRKHRAGI